MEIHTYITKDTVMWCEAEKLFKGQLKRAKKKKNSMETLAYVAGLSFLTFLISVQKYEAIIRVIIASCFIYAAAL